MARAALMVALTATLGAASAQERKPIEIIERSYELALASVVLPSGPAGSVVVKPCAACANVAHRVDAGTTYLLNRAAVPFAEFVRAAEERRRSDGGRTTSVGVYYDIESQRVKRILLSFAAP